MTIKNYKQIKCCLCDGTIGFNFDNKTIENTYCGNCGLAIMLLTNSLVPKSYPFTSPLKFWQNERKSNSASHNTLMNSTHLTYYMMNNQLDELVLKTKEEIDLMYNK